MKSINQVTLLGNLTKDPVVRYTKSGKAVTSFSIATNYPYKDKQTDEWKEKPEFHNVVFWGKSAEIIGQYLFKGKRVYIQGRLQTRSWETEDGVKRYSTEVVGKDFILLSPKDKAKKQVKVEKSEQEKDADEAFGIGEIEEKPENEVSNDPDMASNEEVDDINGEIPF